MKLHLVELTQLVCRSSMTGGLERACLNDWSEWVWIAATTGGLEQ